MFDGVEEGREEDEERVVVVTGQSLQQVPDRSEQTWLIASGWTTAHLKRGEGPPIDVPAARWTECGRLMRALVEALPHDKHCGQCLRRRAAA